MSLEDDDRLHAVLPPPALEKFREITGTGQSRLAARFDGWSKLALMTDEVVYLFPRRGRDDALGFDADVCATLADLGIETVPSVVGRWRDFESVAGLCVGFERRHGHQWSDIEEEVSLGALRTMLQSLARAIAAWHRVDASALPVRLRRPATFDPKPTLSALLSSNFRVVVEEAVRRSGVDDSVAEEWCARVEPVAMMNEVFVHGDVCENQLIVDDAHAVQSVLDWDTAGMGHPLHDFDFGEWGFGLYKWEQHFPELRAAMWAAYVAERGEAELPDGDAVNLAFSLAEFTYFARHRDAGTLNEWRSQRLANTKAALAAAT